MECYKLLLPIIAGLAMTNVHETGKKIFFWIFTLLTDSPENVLENK